MSRQLDITGIRARLAASNNGRQMWRSLEELAQTEEFQDMVEREFPHQAGEIKDPVTRRTFLKLMGASLALGGLSGCQFAFRQPQEKIVPYVSVPEGVVAGKALFFATAMAFDGYGLGLLVESHEGRPTKIEGNPKHPLSLGGTDAFAQASILNMYDPDRSQTVLNAKQPSTWSAAVSAIQQALSAEQGSGGAGLRILTGTVTSPTLIGQIQQLLTTFPNARWYQYDAVGQENTRAGARLAYGANVTTTYNFAEADVVLAIESDFTTNGPGALRYSRDFFRRRRVTGDHASASMNRLYVAESTPTNVGTVADHRLTLRPSYAESVLRMVAVSLGVSGVAAPTSTVDAAMQQWVDAVVNDLRAAAGRSIVVVGESQPPVVHAIAHAINQSLGSVGRTVFYIDPVEGDVAPETIGVAGLRALTQEMDAGQVSLLVTFGTNPAFTAPADIPFASAMAKVATSVHLGEFVDETADLATWHIPGTHYLEMWGDVRTFDGTASIIQPLIAPLYENAKSSYQLMALLNGDANANSYDLVRAYWQSQLSGDFEMAWNIAVRDGVIANTALPTREVSLASGFDSGPSPVAAGELEIAFRPDPTIWDGSYANNGWMQELPKPLTKLTWDNAALVAPDTADKLGLATNDVVKLTLDGRSVEAAVFVMPGHARNTITLYFGYGRTKAGKVAQNTGFNVYPLRASNSLWFGGNLTIEKTGKTYELVTTQNHYSMEGRDIVRVGTLAEYRSNGHFFDEKYPSHHGGGHGEEGEGHAAEGESKHTAPISLYPKYDYSKNYAWGMAIDLNACNGCNACVVACQAENNIPIVGKDQVKRGRAMHWIRIDRYYDGGIDEPETYHMPMLCQHCENAPCEPVCPVNATSHDAEGLNNMVYNRCIGTKYCSNNCPFKVRRFNFLQYSDETTPSLKLQRNPEVTVRSRGVMEKCTFCVQRINHARTEAIKAGRTIADGEVRTACQQVCPNDAIVFGNLNDHNSAVFKLQQENTSYKLLNDLGVNSRITYMPRIRNASENMPSVTTELEHSTSE
jgi:MoCo/4Fe-4S cofactor protein with predicted Tat translocation signal